MEGEQPSIREAGDTGLRRADLRAVAGRRFLGRLTPDLIEELVQSSHSAWYPVGAILPPAPEGTGPALVLAGRLRFYLAAPDGRQLTVHYALPGDIVGTVSTDQVVADPRGA